MSTLLKRKTLAEITRFLPTDDIKVIHGARQVRKTSILMVLQAELHIPIFLTGETFEVAEYWLKMRPRGSQARTQSTLVVHKGKPQAMVN